MRNFFIREKKVVRSMSCNSALVCNFGCGVPINRMHTEVFVKRCPEQDQESKWHQGEYCEAEIKYEHLMSLCEKTVTIRHPLSHGGRVHRNFKRTVASIHRSLPC